MDNTKLINFKFKVMDAVLNGDVIFEANLINDEYYDIQWMSSNGKQSMRYEIFDINLLLSNGFLVIQ